MAGFRAFIPESFLGKKGFTAVTRSIADIASRRNESMLKIIVSIRMVFDKDNKIMDRVEFTFITNDVPESTSLKGYVLQFTPVVSHCQPMSFHLPFLRILCRQELDFILLQ